MIKTLSLKRLLEFPKLKMKKRERVYDNEWHMYFPSEEARLEFRAAIERAENDPISYTQEEVDRYFLKSMEYKKNKERKDIKFRIFSVCS